MKISVDVGADDRLRTDLLAIPLAQASKGKGPIALPPRLRSIDRALGGTISAVLKGGDFAGKRDESTLLYAGGAARIRRVLLLGLGEGDHLDAETLRAAAGRAVTAATRAKARSAALWVPSLHGLPAETAAQALAEGATLATYRFDRYKDSSAENGGAPPRAFALIFATLPKPAPVRAAATRGVRLADCQNVARRLSNEPPNALPPEVLAREARKVAREVGLRSRVFDVPALRRRRMGALLAVGQGSASPPRLIVLEYNAPRSGARRRPTVCVVGKGITFDTGGISIKPSQGMPDMKHDMSGGAAVIGILRAAALLKLPLHVVGVIAAAENMPGGRAYRPSDIVRSMSGKTIEILNTDAEGRVVLADALHYANTEFGPEAILDLATLTGACIVALGPWATGAFSEDERLLERVRRAGQATGERAWPMPLMDEHKRAMRSPIADLRNVGGRDGGASLAAGFLAAFVGDTPWVHLDIAGTANTDKPGPYQPQGATGVGVRLVTEILAHWGDD